MPLKSKVFNSIHSFDKTAWQTLSANAGPFLQYEFLSTLEDSICVGGETYWQPKHIGVFEGDKLIAAIPGYLKFDSYGEYVFDFAWANAYHQHGLDYYPKWISAIPFTPVSGPRILSVTTPISRQVISTINEAIDALHTEMNISSAHFLFPTNEQRDALSGANYLVRYSVQFQWHNRGFATFDDFLSVLTSRKRKDMRKARRKIREQNIAFNHYSGAQISDEVVSVFLHCYQSTYLKRSGHKGYLNQAFFEQLIQTMGSKVLIVVAYKDGAPLASALFLFDQEGLYGRYWGSLQEVDGLHFETCYMQGIDFAIENNISKFNPGTQGEHKILRGFEPIYCYSVHRLYHPSFHDAVRRFLLEEEKGIKHYYAQAFDALPFNENYINTITKNTLTTNECQSQTE